MAVGSTQWTFFTNHAHVLFLLSQNPDARMRDLAQDVGITERAVHRILHELREDGYVEIERVGRRNTYVVILEHSLRHPVEEHLSLGDLVRALKRKKRRVAS